jgi:predicted ester cyclase
MTPSSLVLDLVERVWNGGDLDVLGDYYAPSFEHDGSPSTIAELREWHQEDRATWAGTAYSVLECVGNDESVALLWHATSTHVGPWGPVPSTGRRVEWVGAHFFRVEGDRIVALRSLSDRFGKAIQLGAHLAPAESPELPGDDEGAG